VRDEAEYKGDSEAVGLGARRCRDAGGVSATVARVVLREQVKELILARILSGEYGPGERLVETRIAQELGTSQAPVREALRDLELLRFIESEPFRGARVRAVSDEELIEIYPVRAAIEEVAAREAAVRLDGDVAALEAEVAAMHAAADAGDLHSQVEHDVEFHRLIIEASGNSILLDVWASLRVEIRTVVTALRTGIDGHEIAELHRPVVEALRARDPERAGAALRRHVEHFGELLKGAPA
jgi:DNA-binding GntR family transcriptional regulator